MKLLVLCFGAVVAASVVAAIDNGPDTAAADVLTFEKCLPDEFWAMAERCVTPGAAGPSHGLYGNSICCYFDQAIDGENHDICQAAYGECSNLERDCPRNVLRQAVEDPEPCPCANPCCEETTSLNDVFGILFLNFNEPWFYSKWLTWSSLDNDVSIDHNRVGICGNGAESSVFVHYFHEPSLALLSDIDGPSNGSAPTGSSSTGDYKCVRMCCHDCCENVEVSIIDAKINDCAFPLQRARYTRFERDSVWMCRKLDSSKKMLLYSQNLGVVAYEGIFTEEGYAFTLGCSRKQGGGNAFLQENEDTSD